MVKLGKVELETSALIAFTGSIKGDKLRVI